VDVWCTLVLRLKCHHSFLDSWPERVDYNTIIVSFSFVKPLPLLLFCTAVVRGRHKCTVPTRVANHAFGDYQSSVRCEARRTRSSHGHIQRVCGSGRLHGTPYDRMLSGCRSKQASGVKVGHVNALMACLHLFMDVLVLIVASGMSPYRIYCGVLQKFLQIQ
jgi:hypothetical protein